MSYSEYREKVKGDYRQAIKIEWLNPDESVKFDITNELYDINASVNVNYQNGSRRTCTITLNNDANKFPIDFNNIWVNQKFKLWMGIYLNDNTPYLLPQGVFYVLDPEEIYNPSTRTITINGVDKWAFLDGTISGTLSGTYQTLVGVDLFQATRELLNMPEIPISYFRINGDNANDWFNITSVITPSSLQNDKYCFHWDYEKFCYQSYENSSWKEYSVLTTLEAKQDLVINFDYSFDVHDNCILIKICKEYIVGYEDESGNIRYGWRSKSGKVTNKHIKKGEKITIWCNASGMSNEDWINIQNMVITTFVQRDPVPPFLSPYYIDRMVEIPSDGTTVIKKILECPYTAKVEKGKTCADVLLEYATILCAKIYYDVNGRLNIKPSSSDSDDITDTDKEILWDYTVNEKTFLGLTQTYNFQKIHNDIIVLGNVVNGYQFKGRVQNRNPLSNTSIQRIGLKTREPYEDNQYYSDEQCVELAKYYAKVDTILQKSGNISSVPLYHLDVDKLVSVSTPNNNMSKELFLITGFSLSSSGSMTVNITSVNVLNDFSVVEAEVYE